MQRIRAGRGVGKGTVAQPDIKVVSMWSTERHPYKKYHKVALHFNAFRKGRLQMGVRCGHRLGMYCMIDQSARGNGPGKEGSVVTVPIVYLQAIHKMTWT